MKEEGEEPVADEVVPEPDVAAAPPAPEGAAAGGGEPTLILPVPTPSPLPSVIAPTAVAVATQVALAPAIGLDEAATGATSVPGINWLRVTEVLLGAALVLLIAATIFFTIERRRAR